MARSVLPVHKLQRVYSDAKYSVLDRRLTNDGIVGFAEGQGVTERWGFQMLRRRFWPGGKDLPKNQGGGGAFPFVVFFSSVWVEVRQEGAIGLPREPI